MKLDKLTIVLFALAALVFAAGQIKPVTPVDPVPPSPIADKGLRVLIVWETSTQPSMPDTQRDILFATAAGSVREYLATHCVKVGTTPEFRILDKDQPDGLARESAAWQALWKRERKSLPWIVIANGVTGFEGPLPPTSAEVLALLAKYEVAP